VHVPSDAARLIDRANSRLRELGADFESGFACPLCLRWLPDGDASQGHYPARSIGSGQAELLCGTCNSFQGHAYEADAELYFKGQFRVATRFEGTGRMRGVAKIKDEDGVIVIDEQSRKPGTDRHFEAMRQAANNPHEVVFEIEAPDPGAANRSLLAWSYLAWFWYAGYLYALSPGAAYVRNLLLDPTAPLPPGLMFASAPLELPLPHPEPLVLFHSSSAPLRGMDDVSEWLGLGVAWGSVTVVLPFANDGAGVGYERTSGMLAADPEHVGSFPMRKMFSIDVIEKGIRDEMRVSHGAVLHAITQRPPEDELQALVADRHPRRVVPPARRRSRPARRLSHVVQVSDQLRDDQS
jgi:hypothetical protein